MTRHPTVRSPRRRPAAPAPRLHLPALAGAAALLALAACDDDGPTGAQPLDAPAGCYDLTLGAWRPALEEGLPALPRTVRLLDERGTSVLEDGRLLARAVGAPLDYRWAFWEVRADTLRVVFSTGFTGAELRLQRRGTRLVGEAQAFYDYVPNPGNRAAATLAPRACP